MALPFFFIENIPASNQIVLPEETSKHCVQVLRMKVGEHLQLTDGKGNLLTARLINGDKKNCIAAIEKSNFQQPNSKKISIGISLLKNNNRFEWFLEKATEIGVNEIIPLICKRTERQHFRQERMNNILIAAMLQSQQTWLPFLHEPTLFQEVITGAKHTLKLIAHCEDAEKNHLSNHGKEMDVQILIGPEGDFTQEEIESASRNNYQPVSLGKTRLRTETAGVVAVALLMNT